MEWAEDSKRQKQPGRLSEEAAPVPARRRTVHQPPANRMNRFTSAIRTAWLTGSKTANICLSLFENHRPEHARTTLCGLL